MFAIAAVIVFAIALLLDLIDVGVDFAWVTLGLLLLACHFAFGGRVSNPFNRP
jgi:hypothetical protein